MDYEITLHSASFSFLCPPPPTLPSSFISSALGESVTVPRPPHPTCSPAEPHWCAGQSHRWAHAADRQKEKLLLWRGSFLCYSSLHLLPNALGYWFIPRTSQRKLKTQPVSYCFECCFAVGHVWYGCVYQHETISPLSILHAFCLRSGNLNS